MAESTPKEEQPPVSESVLAALDVVMWGQAAEHTTLMLAAAQAAGGEVPHVLVVAANHDQAKRMYREFADMTGGHQRTRDQIVYEGTRYTFTTTGSEEQASRGISGLRFIDPHALRCELERLCRPRF